MKRTIAKKVTWRVLAFLLLIVGLSLVGLASHNKDDVSGTDTHPTYSGRALNPNTDGSGWLNKRIRDNTGSIRVLVDISGYTDEVDTAISRWNSAMGRTVFSRVTSGTWELRIRYRTSGECTALSGFNAFFVNTVGGSCGTAGWGAPRYEQVSQGYILLNSSFDSLGRSTQITGLVHEMGHDLGIQDHYYTVGVPACRSDVSSIMENWGCSGGSPTSHDAGDVDQAYRIGGVPWVNYISVNSSTSATLNLDTVNAVDHSVHNEKASSGMRIRKRSSLEGSVLSTVYKSRSISTNSYSYSFTIENGEKCWSANGRSNYDSSQDGNDGSEVCINRLAIGGGYAIGTSDTHNGNDRDYFRLVNYTGSTITSAKITTLSGTFISWVTQPGQSTGRVNNNGTGQAYNLNIAKGAYQFRFNIGATPYTIQVGLDD